MVSSPTPLNLYNSCGKKYSCGLGNTLLKNKNGSLNKPRPNGKPNKVSKANSDNKLPSPARTFYLKRRDKKRLMQLQSKQPQPQARGQHIHNQQFQKVLAKRRTRTIPKVAKWTLATPLTPIPMENEPVKASRSMKQSSYRRQRNP